MLDKKKIEKEGIKLIESFSEILENIPQSDETHYVVDLKNVKREDGEAVMKKDFHKKMKKLAPNWSEGYVVAEKAP